MSSYLFNQLSRQKTKYSDKLVRRSVVVIRHSTVDRTLNKHKTFLINSLSSIIVRNVNNFFKLVKFTTEERYIIHTKDDIVMECYLILEKCIEKFDLSLEDKRFYFYYNKALSMGLYRIAKNKYGENHSKVDFDDISKFENKTTTTTPHPLLLSKNFTNKEILIMQGKVSEEPINDICKKLEITRVEYYKTLNKIKTKCTKFLR